MNGRARGYTLLELVMTISVVAVLAAVAAPRFSNSLEVRAAAAARQVAVDIRSAQRLATTTHVECGVLVVSGSTYRVFTASTATPRVDPLERVAQDTVLSNGYGADVTIGPVGALVTFDVRGRLKSGSAATLTVGGRTLTITPETGHVR